MEINSEVFEELTQVRGKLPEDGKGLVGVVKALASVSGTQEGWKNTLHYYGVDVWECTFENEKRPDMVFCVDLHKTLQTYSFSCVRDDMYGKVTHPIPELLLQLGPKEIFKDLLERAEATFPVLSDA